MMNYQSPIVQQMLSNTPPANLGNFAPWNVQPQYNQAPMPGYIPPMTSQPINNGWGSSFPNQYGFNNNDLNGYYNPFFTPGLGRPEQPYMYYNPYDARYANQNLPYGYNQQQYSYYQPLEPYQISFMEFAHSVNMTVQEAASMQNDINRKITIIASKNAGCTDEQIRKNIEKFEEKPYRDPREDYMNRMYNMYSLKKFPHVVAKVGDKVLADSNMKRCNLYTYANAAQDNERIEYEYNMRCYNILNYWNNLYNNAIEREADNMDLYDFFEKVAPKISRQMTEQKLRQQRYLGIKKLYDQNNFKNMINYDSNGYLNAFRGNQGGEIGQLARDSIHISPNGSINLSAPQFVRDRLKQMGEDEKRREELFRPNNASSRLDELRRSFIESTRAVARREKSIHGNSI